MKRKSITFTVLFASIFCLTSLTAQNEKVSIQGTLKNANGTSVDDGTYSVTFKLYNDETAGNTVWTELATVEVAGGIYSHNLGSVTPLPPSIFAQTLYLGVRIGTYELTPRTELTYAPYALSVGFAQKVVCSGAVGDVKYSILNPTQFAAENGTCWVPMDGRALAATDKLRTITGLTALPNGGGMFLRSQEFSNSANNDPGRTSASAIAQSQSFEIQGHNHTGTTNNDGAHSHTDNEASFTTAAQSTAVSVTLGGNGWSWNNDGGEANVRPGGSDHTHAFTTNSTGGTETRPINLNFWIYIRIN